jgi:hypothetical protein
LVNDDAHDAISTVTPATFAPNRHPRMLDFSNYIERNVHESATTSNASNEALKIKRRRKLLIGGIVFVALMLVAVIITVPVVVSKSSRAAVDIQVSSAEKGPAGIDDENKEQTAVISEDEKDDQTSNYNVTFVGSDYENAAIDPEFAPQDNDLQLISASDSSSEPDEALGDPNTSTSENASSEEAGEAEIQPTSQSSPSAPTPSVNSPNIFAPTSDGGPSAPTGSMNSPVFDSAPSQETSVISYSTPVPIPAPTNSNVNRPSAISSVAETPPPTYAFEEDTPLPTYLFSTPAPQLPTLQPTKFTESVVRISLQTDKQGYETSWSLESIQFDAARSRNISTVIAAVDENTYSSYQKDSKKFTLSQGLYRFTLRDTFGDGFCCKDFEGYYSITIDGREIIKGGYFRSEITYDFLVGYFPEMTKREHEWLEAHNVRRKQWHEGHGVSYVPLRWSAALAQQAQTYADKLTEACEIEGIEHEDGVEEGENLAKNRAGGRSGMGQLYPPDNILKRWVDYEADLPNPHNLHLTQALWRASKYVGCADGLREYEDGSVCRLQVCRYAKAGNCQMGKYNVTEGDNW